MEHRRWWTLAAVSIATLMFGVDGTIMNIALPSAGQELGLTESAAQWVVTAYALAFGLLLLPSGRLGQWIGYRRALLTGLLGFALTSLIGGLATAGWVLIAARAGQGVFGALITPAALALLSLTFSGAERGRAFGVFATVAGSGTAVGMLAGGLITEYLGWRWAMLVNVPIAATALVIALYSTSGVSAAADRGGPLVPWSLLRNGPRRAAYLAMFAWGVTVISAFLTLTYLLQEDLGYGAARTGLAFLAYPLAIQIGVRLIRSRLAQIPARLLMTPGLVLFAAGALLLTRLEAGASYFPEVLLVFLLLGFGSALTLPVANSTATLGAGSAAGVAGAMGQTSAQAGAAIGTTLIPSASLLTVGLLVVAAGLVWWIAGRTDQVPATVGAANE